MNIEQIDRATDGVLNRGIRVMTPFLYGPTERGHVATLLQLMAPPLGAHILDAGCGVGEVAKIMRELRPDLRFTLLNLSERQLSMSPDGMRKIIASFDAVPEADESFDVVLFSAAICHSQDWLRTLTEARRVVKEGGQVFISDMERLSGDNVLMAHMLQSAAWPQKQVVDVAQRAGLRLVAAIRPPAVEHRLRELLPAAEHQVMLGGVAPVVWRFERRTVNGVIESAFARHERIAFQFSGGRDSTAALYTLRPYWRRMTIYHLDTGDAYPETQAVVDEVAKDVPVVTIQSDVRRYRETVGWPTDVLPVGATPLGRQVDGGNLKLVNRFECCWNNLMRPMHERMLSDGITLIIRGQRDEDYSAPPARSGAVENGVEVLFPIQSWSTAQVDAYLAAQSLPMASFYAQGGKHGPECMGCTAWWDDGRFPWLRKQHPVVFKEFERRMRLIGRAIGDQLQPLYEGMTDE